MNAEHLRRVSVIGSSLSQKRRSEGGRSAASSFWRIRTALTGRRSPPRQGSGAGRDYVGFLDADDVSFLQKLEGHTDPRRPARSPWWYSWTRNAADDSRDFVLELGALAGRILRPPMLIGPFFRTQRAAIPTPASILVRRALADDAGGLDTTVRDVDNDQAFYAKIRLQALVLASPTVWRRYRQHAGSNTTRAPNRGDERVLRARFLTSPIGYLSAQGFQDSHVYATLDRQPFECAQPLLSRIATRFRFGA